MAGAGLARGGGNLGPRFVVAFEHHPCLNGDGLVDIRPTGGPRGNGLFARVDLGACRPLAAYGGHVYAPNNAAYEADGHRIYAFDILLDGETCAMILDPSEPYAGRGRALDRQFASLAAVSANEPGPGQQPNCFFIHAWTRAEGSSALVQVPMLWTLRPVKRGEELLARYGGGDSASGKREGAAPFGYKTAPVQPWEAGAERTVLSAVGRYNRFMRALEDARARLAHLEGAYAATDDESAGIQAALQAQLAAALGALSEAPVALTPAAREAAAKAAAARRARESESPTPSPPESPSDSECGPAFKRCARVSTAAAKPSGPVPPPRSKRAREVHAPVRFDPDAIAAQPQWAKHPKANEGAGGSNQPAPPKAAPVARSEAGDESGEREEDEEEEEEGRGGKCWVGPDGQPETLVERCRRQKRDWARKRYGRPEVRGAAAALSSEPRDRAGDGGDVDDDESGDEEGDEAAPWVGFPRAPAGRRAQARCSAGAGARAGAATPASLRPPVAPAPSKEQAFMFMRTVSATLGDETHRDLVYVLGRYLRDKIAWGAMHARAAELLGGHAHLMTVFEGFWPQHMPRS